MERPQRHIIYGNCFVASCANKLATTINHAFKVHILYLQYRYTLNFGNNGELYQRLYK